MSNNEFFNTKQIPDSCADCQPTGNANAEEGNVDSNNGSHVNTQTYSIVPESPKTRPMDLSPNELAAALNCVNNTIKSRMSSLDVKFLIEKSNYALYNYECLPIIKAYLHVPSWKESERNNLQAFFKRLSEELNDEHASLFCKTYLYNNKAFQQYLLQSRISEPIIARTKIIRTLVRNLTSTPIIENTYIDPRQQLSDVLLSLDNIIFNLANYSEFAISASDDSFSNRQSNSVPPANKSLKTPKLYANKWCKELKNYRSRITANAVIKLFVPINATVSELQKALDQRLIESYGKYPVNHSQEDCVHQSQLFNSLLEKIDDMNLSAMFDSPQPQRITKTQLQTLMSGLSDAYMEAVLELEAPPTFYELTILFSRSIKDESRLLKTLHPVLISHLNEWYDQAVTILAKQQQIFTVSSVYLLCNSQDANPEYRQSATNAIRSFWISQKEANYITDSLNSSDMTPIIHSIVKNSKISLRKLKIEPYQLKICDSLVSLFLMGEDKAMDFLFIQALSAISMEAFWHNHTIRYLEYFGGLFEQYQKAMLRFPSTSVK